MGPFDDQEANKHHILLQQMHIFLNAKECEIKHLFLCSSRDKKEVMQFWSYKMFSAEKKRAH